MSVISIDLWGTLIKSSPTFVDSKVELTGKYFPNTSRAFMLECYSSTKQQLNNIIENTGWQPSDEVIFKLLFSRLNGGIGKFSIIYEFIHDYQELAKKHMPILYSEDTFKWLGKLSLHHKMILSSNTMLISGNSLSYILQELSIHSYFDRLNFSDKIGVSKPNPIMYSDSDYHIGDNPVTDGIGARLAGCIPIIINSNQNTIEDAYNIINQK